MLVELLVIMLVFLLLSTVISNLLNPKPNLLLCALIVFLYLLIIFKINIISKKINQMIFSAQIRAARGLLQISQVELSTDSGLSLQTIKNFEQDDEAIKKASFTTLEKVKVALENRGIRFTFSKEKDERGKFLEIGVKLRTG